MALTSTAVTAYCILQGYKWPTPSIASGYTIASSLALVIEASRERSRRDSHESGRLQA